MRLLAVALPVCLLALAQAPAPPTPKYLPPAPEQPIPFSHRVHTGLGLECKTCHVMPDPGDFATLPETSTCMKCHQSVKTDSSSIQKLKEFHDAKKEVPWRPVYRIPDYVFFNHRHHVTVGKAACETCHGPVREKDVLRKERDISMAGCMECHRAAQASLACNYCHEQR